MTLGKVQELNQMQHAVESRRAIGYALGILMESYHLEEKRAVDFVVGTGKSARASPHVGIDLTHRGIGAPHCAEPARRTYACATYGTSMPGLIASGCDVVAVQCALGRTRSTTTLTTHAHLRPTAEDRVRDAAAHLFAEVPALVRAQ